MDFQVSDRGEGVGFYQVCEYMAEAAIRKREISTLWQAMEELELSKARIITRHERDKIEKMGTFIEVVLFWDWVLFL